MYLYDVPSHTFENLLEQQVRYGIISIPFTYDRMHYNLDILRRVSNIIKGKIAEELFFLYAKSINLSIDSSSCQTPFYRTDKRDFLYNGLEWDIKNNFVLKEFEKINASCLPALVPEDQWAKRTIKKFTSSSGVGFCFTFMEKLGGGEPVSVSLSSEQDAFLRELYRKYQGSEQSSQPYSENWFFDKFGKITYKHNFKHRILVAGYCIPDMHSMFKSCSPRSFCDGAINTRISNYTLDCSLLNQF